MTKNIKLPIGGCTGKTLALCVFDAQTEACVLYTQTNASVYTFESKERDVCIVVGHFCYLCFVFVMLSYLFIAALWSPAGKGLNLVCGVSVTSHVVSWVRSGT